LSRELNDDFDEDDLPSGSLDLEKGSGQVGAGVPSTYGNDGIDFDDDLYGSDDAGANKALELDLPNAPHAAPRTSGSPGAPPGGPMDVPDLAFDATPQRGRSGQHPAAAPPPPRSSGSLPAVRTSGAHPAAGQSGQHPAAGGIPSAPPSSSRGASGAHAPAAPPGDEGHHGFAPPAPSSASGLDDPSGPHSAPLPPSAQSAQMAPPPPARPTAAAVIAKYPYPPTKITQAPMYTVRVILRQLELRTDLESLRRRRSPDVPLYEAALRAYDTRTFRLGMAINCAVLAIATFVFFLPVMIRFIRAD
jgi:hypothetical protein